MRKTNGTTRGGRRTPTEVEAIHYVIGALGDLLDALEIRLGVSLAEQSGRPQLLLVESRPSA